MDCRQDTFTLGDGKLDGRLTCGAGAGSAIITMQGTYSSDTFKLAMTTETKGAGPAGSMSMVATIDAKRTRACSGKEGRGQPVVG